MAMASRESETRPRSPQRAGRSPTSTTRDARVWLCVGHSVVRRGGGAHERKCSFAHQK